MSSRTDSKTCRRRDDPGYPSDPIGTPSSDTGSPSSSAADSPNYYESSTSSPSNSDPTGTSSTPILPTSAADSSPTATASAKPQILVTASTINAGAIAGGVVGGVVFLVLVALGILLYLRKRKRERTPPSSEFINSIRAGVTPVLRLDSGAEYAAGLSEKSTSHTTYPPTVPLPFTQNSYYTSPPMANMKFPDDLTSDLSSGRPSIERPLHPQRYSSLRQASDTFVAGHHPSASVASHRDLWESDIEVVSGRMSPSRQSPAHTSSVFQLAPHFSLDDSFPLPSHSPSTLHPLRRQPDPEDT